MSYSIIPEADNEVDNTEQTTQSRLNTAKQKWQVLMFKRIKPNGRLEIHTLKHSFHVLLMNT